MCVHVSVCVLNIPGPKTYFARRNKKVKLICVYTYICVYIYIYIYIYIHVYTHIYYIYAGCAGSSLLYTDFSCSKQGLHSRRDPWASHCSDFFCHRAQVLEHKFSSFSA